jgi:hypothetical protein
VSGFARKIKRNVTKDVRVERKRVEKRVFRAGRLLWCTKCKASPQNWNQTKREPFPDGKPNKEGTLLCKDCGTPLVHCDKLDLPPESDGKGLWVRPQSQDGWASEFVRTKEQAEIDLIKTMAAPEVGERPKDAEPTAAIPLNIAGTQTGRFPVKVEGVEGGDAPVEGGVR